MSVAGYYAIRFVGHLGMGLGGVCLLNGKVLGIDSNNVRYNGEYTEGGGRLKGTIRLSHPDGGTLITGQHLPAGQLVPVTFDLSAEDFARGFPQSLLVAGNPVAVVLEKLGDLG